MKTKKKYHKTGDIYYNNLLEQYKIKILNKEIMPEDINYDKFNHKKEDIKKYIKRFYDIHILQKNIKSII